MIARLWILLIAVTIFAPNTIATCLFFDYSALLESTHPDLLVSESLVRLNRGSSQDINEAQALLLRAQEVISVPLYIFPILHLRIRGSLQQGDNAQAKVLMSEFDRLLSLTNFPRAHVLKEANLFEFYYSIGNYTAAESHLSNFFAYENSSVVREDPFLSAILERANIMKQDLALRNSMGFPHLEEIWNVTESSKDVYQVDVTIKFYNGLNVTLSNPLLSHQVFFFDKVLTYNENVPGEKIFSSQQNGTLTTGEISEIYHQGADSPLMRNRDLAQQRNFFFPFFLSTLQEQEYQEANVSFTVNKSDFITRFATQTKYYTNSVPVTVNKTISLLVDDIFLSNFKDYNITHLRDGYGFTKMIALNASSGPMVPLCLDVGKAHLISDSAVNLVFGFHTPSTKALEFDEKITIDDDEISVSRRESREIFTNDSDVFIFSSMYNPDTRTSEIRWSREKNGHTIEKKPKLDFSKIENKIVRLDYDEPFYTLESDGVRTLFFKVLNEQKNIEFSYGYSANRSAFVSRKSLSKYQMKYDVVYSPGAFGRNLYNFDFVFGNNLEVIKATELSGCVQDRKVNKINYNCELPRFRTKDSILIEFVDVKQQNRIYQAISAVIVTLLWFLLALRLHIKEFAVQHRQLLAATWAATILAIFSFEGLLGTVFVPIVVFVSMVAYVARTNQTTYSIFLERIFRKKP